MAMLTIYKCSHTCSQDRQSSWQNFQKGKVTKKKKPAGFMTGMQCATKGRALPSGCDSRQISGAERPLCRIVTPH